jgi:hypothetical protein
MDDHPWCTCTNANYSFFIEIMKQVNKRRNKQTKRDRNMFVIVGVQHLRLSILCYSNRRKKKISKYPVWRLYATCCRPAVFLFFFLLISRRRRVPLWALAYRYVVPPFPRLDSTQVSLRSTWCLLGSLQLCQPVASRMLLAMPRIVKHGFVNLPLLIHRTLQAFINLDHQDEKKKERTVINVYFFFRNECTRLVVSCILDWMPRDRDQRVPVGSVTVSVNRAWTCVNFFCKQGHRRVDLSCFFLSFIFFEAKALQRNI